MGRLGPLFGNVELHWGLSILLLQCSLQTSLEAWWLPRENSWLWFGTGCLPACSIYGGFCWIKLWPLSANEACLPLYWQNAIQPLAVLYPLRFAASFFCLDGNILKGQLPLKGHPKSNWPSVLPPVLCGWKVLFESLKRLLCLFYKENVTVIFACSSLNRQKPV